MNGWQPASVIAWLCILGLCIWLMIAGYRWGEK